MSSKGIILSFLPALAILALGTGYFMGQENAITLQPAPRALTEARPVQINTTEDLATNLDQADSAKRIIDEQSLPIGSAVVELTATEELQEMDFHAVNVSSDAWLVDGLSSESLGL